MSALTKFRVGEMYRNIYGVYTVEKLLDDDNLNMEVYCNYDGKARVFDIRIAQLTIYRMRREGRYEEIY